MPELHTPASASSDSLETLLPTPSGYESTPTEEYVEEMREAGIDPGERLYLPGRKWHSQRTLSRLVPALLPTPSANDHTGGEGATRTARQEAGRTGGPMLRDLTHLLLPTPTAGDAKSAGSRNLPGSNANAGVSLTDLFRTGGSTTPRRGEPSPPPSSAGSASEETLPPAQLTLEDA